MIRPDFSVRVAPNAVTPATFKTHDRGQHFHVAPTWHALAPATTPDIAAEDCSDLMSAVLARLAQTVAEGPASTSGLPLAAVEAKVLECVAALRQIHSSLVQHASQRQQLELELFDVKTTLAQAQAELSGTRTATRNRRSLATPCLIRVAAQDADRDSADQA